MEDKDLIEVCLNKLADKMGYQDYSSLSQRDFDHLCSQVEKETGISLSLSTIKRIFSGKYKRLPQTYTLDALTRFTGYEGWQDFKTQHLRRKTAEQEPSPLKVPSESVSGRKMNWATVATGTGFLLLLILSLAVYSFHHDRKSSARRAENGGTLSAKAAFSARKSVSEGVPNSVIFSYNVDETEADSFFIQTTWDPEKKTPVHKNNYTQTALYYEPGQHNAKLIADGKVIKEVLVDIPVNNWIAFTRISWNEPPVYFKELKAHDGVFGLTETDLNEYKVSADKDRFYVYAWFPSSLPINSDHFRLKTRVRLRSAQNMPCPGIHTTIFGSSGSFYITNTIPGCISELSAQISEKYLSGKTTDLSSFGYELTAWHTIEFIVQQKKVQVFIEGKKVLDQPYEEPAGLIKGLTFRSNGICEIDFTEIRNAQDAVVYLEDFGAQTANSEKLLQAMKK